MIIEFGDKKIITDDRQFIVQAKKIIKEGRFTKAENIGKELWEDAGYFGSFNAAIKYICKTVLLENDDIKTIVEKLNDIEKILKGISKELKED